MGTPVFSNKPKVATRQLTLEEILTLPKFNVLTESSLENNSAINLGAACGDPNLATTFYKNVINQVIRCAGENIDINFIRDLFPIDSKPTMVETKRWYNHYIADTNLNLYFAASATATAAGLPFVAQILKQFHGGSGQYAVPAVGFSLWDKDKMIEYKVVSVDNTIDFAHKVTLQPYDTTIVGSIKANTPYLVTPARRVGGMSEKQVVNAMSSIGYSQEVRPLRVRRDWELSVDILRGYLDKIQYSVMYDIQGNEMDAWDLYEAQQARLGVQMLLNMASFWGTPTTNASLMSDTNTALVDSLYTGFYGMIPSLRYGGAVVYPFRPSVGFDLENDGEPLFLWQDSQKRTSKFMILHGLAWEFGLTNRTNKLIARTDAGKYQWEAYKRMGALSGDDYQQSLTKLGVSSYKYNSFELDMKRIGAFSDARFAGSDYWNNMGICMPQHGVKQNGKNINPIEFYQVGKNGWTGEYFESYVDNRFQTVAKESLQGYCAESIAMATHAPEFWMLLDPQIDS